ncbi:hypothetical protein FRB91_010320 [Serendipita sp. 411]|nr:hypothetical protein FRC18_010955 [Serendipita sp. 400]KAG8849009.1 hypothetical protein FRB91_010320 [Serendipita sp. 411]
MRVTWFASTRVTGNAIVIALIGFCFAVSRQVSFSLLAEQISSHGGNDGNAGAGYQPLAMEGDQEREEKSIAMRQRQRQHRDGQTHVSGAPTGVVFDSGEESVTRDRRADEVDGDGERRPRKGGKRIDEGPKSE